MTLLALVCPGIPARGTWRFPDFSAARLDDKVRFVDAPSGVVPRPNK